MSPSWNEDMILEQFRSYMISLIYNHSIQTKNPIYVLVEDTTCIKSKPSSQTNSTIEGCSWHFSHLNHQHVYGPQFVTVMLKCEELIGSIHPLRKG